MKAFQKALLALVLVIILAAVPVTASAAVDTPYDGYQYDASGNAVEAPVGYIPQKVISGKQLPVGTFGNASDLFVDNDGRINVVDSENGRLIVLSEELEYAETLYFSENGEEKPFPGMAGVFITGSGKARKYYVADPENERVFVADSSRNIFQVLLRPKTELMPSNVSFSPSKVLVDTKGIVYVMIPGLYRGACVFSPEGEFLTFFGSNEVELSARMLLDYFWKSIANNSQKDNMARYIPVEFANFDITPDDFIYTVTMKSVAGGSVISTEEIKRMNAKSVNVYQQENYGDLEAAWSNKTLLDTAFVDIDVMDSGHVVGLDTTQGRVFMYDENGQWITVFGGSDVLKGMFRIPVAIESIGDRVYVLDQMADSITMFIPSDYGVTLLAALDLYNQGLYEQSVPLWQEVIRQSGGYDPAYVSIGKMYLNQGDYETAMDYFKKGHSPELYSDAFKQQRNIVLRKWFYPIFAILVILVVWVVVSDARDRVSKKRDIDPRTLNPFKKAMYVLFHPTEGYEAAVRCQPNKTSAIVSGICLMLWLFATILTWQYNGYIFNQNIAEDFNIWAMFGQTFLVFGLFVLANWFVSTMMDGSGKLIDIVYVVAVGLVPYIGYQLLSLLLSNVLIREEGAFMTLLGVIALLWSVVLIVLGIKTIHEFSLKKTIMAVIFSLLGIVIIIFLSLLLWSLFQQLVSFVAAIYNEISLKLK